MNEQNEQLVDLGNATEQTKGYAFDLWQEPLPRDKVRDFGR